MINWRVFIGLCASAAILGGLWQLASLSNGVTITKTEVGLIPVTVFRPDGVPDCPVIVIAHGFAGSQQLMQPLALTLARNGYVALTFDFSGHGRNPEALPGGIKNLGKSTEALLAEIGQIVAYARTLPGTDHRLALAGHSMASDLVVQYAMKHADVEATAALSLFGQGVTADNPKNLLIIDGAWEIQMLKDAAFRIAGMAAGGPAQERVTYGDFAKGNARRVVLAAGAEHIGVLYSADSLRETVAWMNKVFHRQSTGFIDQRGKWLGLLFAGLVALAYPAARLLPVVSKTPLGASLGWRRLWLAAAAPAILTPLILWKVPTDFLPILLGDYLAVHFALYGLLTFAGLRLVSRRSKTMPGIPEEVGFEEADFKQKSNTEPPKAGNWAALAVGAAAVAAYYILVLGLPLDTYVISFMPNALRWPLIPAMFCGTVIYFCADEWLTRGLGAAKGGYASTKLCFIVSLIAAVALNPQRLFFLVIIVPVILLFFIVYGLISRWVYQRTGDPRVAGLGNAAALAWAISLTFPVISS